MSGSFHDGNVDFEWRRGAVLTAKEKNLWSLMGDIDLEDIEHMKSRLDIHNCRAKVGGRLRDTTPCPHCMCKWIVESAAAFDIRSALQPALVVPKALQPLLPLSDSSMLAQAQPRQHASENRVYVFGFVQIVQAAQFPPALAQKLFEDLVEVGAVDVREVTASDLQSCSSFIQARPLELRRLLTAWPEPATGLTQEMSSMIPRN